MNIQRTNNPQIWQDCRAGTADSMIWMLEQDQRYSIKDFIKMPAWHNSKYLILIDSEGLESWNTEGANIDSDQRIHLWKPIVSDHPRVHNYMFWFDWVRQIEKELNFRDRLIPIESKKPEFYFDALLGTLRSHKRYILNKINQHTDRNLFCLGSLNPSSDNLPDNWLPGHDLDTDQTRNFVNFIRQQTAPVCCMIPYKIYNRSWYSLVCETLSSKTKFYTEKTTKPILAKRIFVMVGSKHLLQGLRSFGFKTFSSIIDESYDDIEDDQQRWQAAWETAEYLLSQDPQKMYHQARSILEHNYQLMTETDWYGKMCKEIHHLLTTI